jgi:hypothetical protein
MTKIKIKNIFISISLMLILFYLAGCKINSKEIKITYSEKIQNQKSNNTSIEVNEYKTNIHELSTMNQIIIDSIFNHVDCHNNRYAFIDIDKFDDEIKIDIIALNYFPRINLSPNNPNNASYFLFDNIFYFFDEENFRKVDFMKSMTFLKSYYIKEDDIKNKCKEKSSIKESLHNFHFKVDLTIKDGEKPIILNKTIFLESGR